MCGKEILFKYFRTKKRKGKRVLIEIVNESRNVCPKVSSRDKEKMVKMLAITRCLTSPSPTIFANLAPDHTTKFVIINIPLLIFHLINVYMFITFIYIKKKINKFFINLTTSYS